MSRSSLLRTFSPGLLILLLGACDSGSAISNSPAGMDPTVSGVPTAVPIGDTLHIGDITIRIKSIDAPEPGLPYARESAAALEQLTRSGISCFDTGEGSRQRMIAWCYTADGQGIGAAMVKSGWAFNAAPAYMSHYATEQREALLEQRGMHRQLP